MIIPVGTSGICQSQFSREYEINDNPFFVKSVCFVIGLGGIGSHVAQILGSFSNLKKLILIDDDIIELHNLNRTLYRYEHIGHPKVQAMAELITSNNCNITIIPIKNQFNTDLCNTIYEDPDFEDLFPDEYDDSFLVFDCRDNFYGDYDLIEKLAKHYHTNVRIIRAAYDQLSITVDTHPEKSYIWGPGGYTIIPSHSIPSRFVALLAVMWSCFVFTTMDPKTKEFLNSPMTFDLKDLPKILMYGLRINSLGFRNKDLIEQFMKKIEEEPNVEEVEEKNI